VRVLTEDAVLKCDHGGVVDIKPRQDWIRISGRAVLIEDDPLNRSVHRCPMITPTTPACARTISISEAPSYAAFVRVQTKGDDRRRLCLDSTTGHTDWSRMATVNYNVTSSGQDFVGVLG
jgi:hypothetical protein